MSDILQSLSICLIGPLPLALGLRIGLSTKYGLSGYDIDKGCCLIYGGVMALFLAIVVPSLFNKHLSLPGSIIGYTAFAILTTLGVMEIGKPLLNRWR